MKRILSSLLLVLVSLLILTPGHYSHASLISINKITEYTNNADAVSSHSYNTNVSFTDILARVIQLVLSILGIIFLILIFIAGTDWMQADGNEEKVTKAKETIRNLIIGLVVVLLGYAITYSVDIVVKTLVK
jgi:small-conductance mechanosensitive channel